MGFTAVAVVGGLVLGLLCGGRLSNLATATLRWPVALIAGIVLQWAPELLGSSEDGAFLLVGASYVSLGAFALANLRLVGMSVVVIGLALNALVIGVNGGMPVRSEAILAAGLARNDPEVQSLDFGSKRHLETADDELTILGDVLPVEPLGEVLSFGDLVLSAGIANLLFRLVRPLRRRHRTVAMVPDDVEESLVIDLRSPTPSPTASRVAS